ncbi:MAG: MFS transporter [Propionibacteriaceae bacterium]|nr:MFS transporter [Propionibacteriaceae bacterium]
MELRDHPKRWIALAGVALGTSLVIMDATIANVALPVIITDLNLTPTQAEWMNAAYSLVFASLMLLSGRLGDLYGRKTMFLIGISGFTLSSLAVGFAPDPGILIAARLAQGISAAMVLPATLSSINALFRGQERPVAFAVYGATIGGMAALGPLIGGWLAASVSWRWAFWLNLPFGLLTLALAASTLPETRDPQLRRGLDIPGTILATLGLGCVVFGLIEATTFGWWRQADGSWSPIPFAIALGLGLLLSFTIVEAQRGRTHRPVLAHLGLFRLRTFRYGAIAAFIVHLGEFGLLFTLPLVLQGAMGYGPLGTGGLILALAVGAFAASGLVPALTRRIGQRDVVRVGLGLEMGAVALLSVTLPSPPWLLSALMFAYGTGVGLATAQLTSVGLAEVPRKLSGEASGLQATVRQLGSALGVALLGGLLITSLTGGTDQRLRDAGLPPQTRSSIVETVRGSVGATIPDLAHDPHLAGAPAGAAESVVGLASEAMVSAARLTTGAAAGFLALGLLSTIALPALRDEPLTSDDAKPVKMRPELP